MRLAGARSGPPRRSASSRRRVRRRDDRGRAGRLGAVHGPGLLASARRRPSSRCERRRDTGQPRGAARQGGAARVLRHVVPALCRRGAAPARTSPGRCRGRGSPSSASTRTASDAPSVFAYHVYFGLPFPARARSRRHDRQLPVARVARAGVEGLPRHDATRRSTWSIRRAGSPGAAPASSPTRCCAASSGRRRAGAGRRRGTSVRRAGGLHGGRDRLRRRLTDLGGESRGPLGTVDRWQSISEALHAARDGRAPGRQGGAQGEPAPHRPALPPLQAQALVVTALIVVASGARRHLAVPAARGAQQGDHDPERRAASGRPARC